MTTTEIAPPRIGTVKIGEPVRRVEDLRLVTGRGSYLGDLHLAELKHIAILRSFVPHGRINAIRTDLALGLPGVLAVYTGRDLVSAARPFSHLLPMVPTLRQIEWYPLAIDKVRYVGEPIAAVVATSRYVAEDALDLIDVDVDPLPPVVDAEAALAPGAPRLYDDWPDNELLFLPHSTGDLDRAFAEADGILRERLTHHRVTGLPLEGHGALGSYDTASGRLTLYSSTQQPHNLRTVISDVTGLSEANIRVIAPDMGGGFGNKAHFFKEEALVALIAMQTSCPVVWSADRVENLTSSLHAREQVHDVEVAYRNDGRVLGLRVRVVADVGNPEVYVLGCAPAIVTTSLLAGSYDIPNYATELHCVVTNKCPMGGYRGYGQPQATFTIERVMDILAARLGMDPVEVRRVNLIPDSPRPFVSPTGARYDTGSFHGQLRQLLESFDYDAARARRDEARAHDRLVGIGFSSMVEATAPNIHALAGRFGCYEMAMVAVHPDGHVTVNVGTKSQGQGHATVFAQVASDVLAVPVEHIAVMDGDTSVLPYGIGTWGSRSAVMGGGAVMTATQRLRDKMTQIASVMLGVPMDQIDLVDGEFRVEGGALPFAQVANVAYMHTFLLPPGMEPGLVAVSTYEPSGTSPFPDPETGQINVGATYASAAAVAVVEVDRNTGKVAILDFVIVHDCGSVINPMILEGQVQGAFAQGVGAVLLEELVYDADGQPLCTTLLDYRVPSFGDVPRARIVHRETPSDLVGGFRGAGEGAIIATPAALANAIEDALRPLGVEIRQTNLAPDRLRALMRQAGASVRPLVGAGAIRE